jgi:hypothetical protein
MIGQGKAEYTWHTQTLTHQTSYTPLTKGIIFPLYKGVGYIRAEIYQDPTNMWQPAADFAGTQTYLGFVPIVADGVNVRFYNQHASTDIPLAYVQVIM